jgi:hypothetical protein
VPRSAFQHSGHFVADDGAEGTALPSKQPCYTKTSCPQSIETAQTRASNHAICRRTKSGDIGEIPNLSLLAMPLRIKPLFRATWAKKNPGAQDGTPGLRPWSDQNDRRICAVTL